MPQRHSYTAGSKNASSAQTSTHSNALKDAQNSTLQLSPRCQTETKELVSPTSFTVPLKVSRHNIPEPIIVDRKRASKRDTVVDTVVDTEAVSAFKLESWKTLYNILDMNGNGWAILLA
jgi:hypothetical protein